MTCVLTSNDFCLNFALEKYNIKYFTPISMWGKKFVNKNENVGKWVNHKTEFESAPKNIGEDGTMN